MSEDPGFTPRSPLTRKPRRNYLIVGVFLIVLVAIGAFLYFTPPWLDWREAVFYALGLTGGVLGLLFTWTRKWRD